MNPTSSGFHRRRGWSLAAVIGFLALLVLPNLDLALGLDPNPSPLRQVVRFPTLARTSLGRLPGQLIWYLQSSMGFRGTLVRARGLVAYRWLGVSPAPSTVIRSDPWFFLKGERVLDDYRRVDPFSPAALEQWRSALEARRSWLARRGIAYLVVLAPNKESVYSEFMPSSIIRRAGPSRLEQLVNRLEGDSRVSFLDLTATLLAAKQRARVYHYTDTHWNDLGAFSAYRAIATRLRAWFPSLKALDWSELRRSTSVTPGGDLARICGLKLDRMEPQIELSLAAGHEPARLENGSAVTFERMDVSGTPRFVTQGPNREIASAVVLRDSFGEALIPYLSQHIGKATWIWTYDFPAELIARERPALVVQELVERKLMVVAPSNPPEMTEP